MATVADIAQRSLRQILVQSSGLSLTTQEIADYIEALNDYMFSLEGAGIRLGFTEVSTSTDEVTVPSSCLRGVVANMAIEVAPEYSAEISQGLMKAAAEGLAVMRRVARQKVQSAYPASLPMGSGNHTVYTQEYYGDRFKALQSLANNTVRTTFTGLSAPTPVRGDWVSEYTTGFRVDVAGLMKATIDRSQQMTVTADMTLTDINQETYKVHIYKNGVSIASSATVNPNGTPTNVVVTVNTLIEPADEIQVYVEAITKVDATAYVVASGTLLCR